MSQTPRNVTSTTRGIIAVAGLVVLASCTSAEDRETSRAAYRDDTVTILDLSDISKPMPFISETTLDGDVVGQMFMGILGARWEDGRLRNTTAEEDALALAKSYEFFGPDSASVRFHLRGDVRWSDGTPLTAHDAVWTIETRGDPRTASPRQEMNQFIESVEAPDDSTLVVHFSRRYPEMLVHVAGPVAPRHVFEGTDLATIRTHPALTNPRDGGLPVSGPYRIGEWLRGQRVTLVPNPEFQPQPRIPRVVFQIIPEETTRLIELQTGNADIMELPFDKLDLVRGSVPDLRFESIEGRVYDYIAYNPLAHPALADPEIRRALGLAIDREGLISALSLDEFGTPAGGPIAPILALVHDPVAEAPLPHDPERAARILDEKGWVPGATGIREKDGRPLRFTLSTNTGNQRRADVAQIVQQAWRGIGVDAQIRTIESNTFFDGLSAARKDFDAAIAGWSVGLFMDMTGLWGAESPFNFVSYDDPETTRLMQDALAQPTEDRAAEYWKAATARIVEAQPYSWLYYMDQVVGVRDRVKGTRIDTLGLLQNLHEWWIEPAGGATEEGATTDMDGG